MKYFLGGYLLRLIDKNTKSFVRLDSFGEWGEDFLYVFRDYLNCIKGRSLLTYENRILALDWHKTDDRGRKIFGVINSGTYGTEAKLVNSDSGEMTYVKTMPEAMLSPFFFLAYFPEGSDFAYLFLQRNGQSGIKINLERDLDKYLSGIFPGFAVEINYMLPTELLNTFLSAKKIKSIKFIKHNAYTTELNPATVSPDESDDEVSDRDELDQISKGDFSVELSIKAKRNQFLPIGDMEIYQDIKRFLASGGKLKGALELRDKTFLYDTVKIECDLNGTRRTFDLGQLHKAYPHFDVTDKISLTKEGYPNMVDMHREAMSMLNDYVVAMEMAMAHDSERSEVEQDEGIAKEAL